MDTLVLKSDSSEDLQLFFNLAKKAGLFARFLNDEDKEDIALSLAINEGLKKDYIDTSDFLNSLENGS
jgi:hypothetical protein